MKDETPRVAINKYVGLNPKMYSCLVDDNSEHKNSGHKKGKGVSKNVVATISHNTNIKMFC